ncbi:dienelactone hydrolase family protein [Microbacterium sp.]|uniref:dienelactone hydrolase family protein n=1 Tax=Microbacterium sp. TaxID=51671 RepID=UPI003F70AAE7
MAIEHAAWLPSGWTREEYVEGDRSHVFYTVDRSGVESPPSVLLMHELWGINPDLLEFAEALAEDFRVVVPSIVGRDGSPTMVDTLTQICIRREVHLFARDGVSRAVPWLRRFATAHVGRGGRYGVVGMCFSGNFALALAVDPDVAAAVVAQPAVPFFAGLGLSDDDRRALGAREKLCVQAYRFDGDLLSREKTVALAEELLGDRRMDVRRLPKPAMMAHSTLTGEHRSTESVARVRAFLRERLTPEPAT